MYTSHYNMSAEELRRAGVSPGTVRVSIGVEDSEDLLADLEKALK
jgi:O-acetylhomoserine (thiol)-lyase